MIRLFVFLTQWSLSDITKDTEKNHCSYYRTQGWCSTSESVKTQCKKTCGFCGGASPTPTPPPTPSLGSCKDTEKNHCSYYRKQGWCSTSESVKKQCKKTCGFCGGASPTPAPPP